METPTFSSSAAAETEEEFNQSNQTEERNVNNQNIDETPRKRRRYDFLYEFEDGNDEGNDNDEGNAEQRTPRRRPALLLPPPAPIFHPRNSNQNQSKFPPQKIAYIQSKIEEKLADIEIESRKEIDKLFQKFSSQIRAAAAANHQNLHKQNDPKSKELDSKK
uniref:Uncharacterized protein n=2 Tax=Panagrolaimus sp. PS1159 TaxID=55785 RepID=A0AC35GAJ3_9BILA